MSSDTYPEATVSQRAAAELRAEMGRQKKSRTQLAELLGISVSAASQRVAGNTPLTLDEVAHVAAWLSVSPLRFFPSDEAAA